MRDFRVTNLKELMEALLNEDYKFIHFKEFNNVKDSKITILRHDVDLLPENSLRTAELENSLGVTGTYYFRTIPETFKPDIIQEIADLGHEVGYHYETVDKVTKSELADGSLRIADKKKSSYEVKKLRSYGARSASDRVTKSSYGVKKLRSYGELEKRREEIIDRAYELFCEELEMFRKVVPVETICMHGSPRAKYDNKMIWSKYDYRELGIVGEPYFDVDWNVFGYLTDTGRRWNGEKYSVRDRVDSRFKFDFKRTEDVIRNVDKLPDKLMITFHPQRWTDEVWPWAKELVWQNSKNLIKRFLVRSER